MKATNQRVARWRTSNVSSQFYFIGRCEKSRGLAAISDVRFEFNRRRFFQTQSSEYMAAARPLLQLMSAARRKQS